MQLVAERGPKPAGEIFRDLMLEREPLPYLGDSLFHWMLRPLLSGPAPVLEERGDADLPWAERELSITHHGHAVLIPVVVRLTRCWSRSICTIAASSS